MSIPKTLGCLLAVAAVSFAQARGEDARTETVRFVRPAADKFVTECQFAITRNEAGWTIVSTTERGKQRLEVVSRYDARDVPLSAKVVLTNGDRSQSATVEFKDGKATIRRDGHKPQEFDAPRGTIVTSAPDWTDLFLLCRRYDKKGKAKQEFPALWVHPTEAPQRLTFTIEAEGTERIAHDGAKVELTRYALRIRNNSAYVAWADAQGRLIRLLPSPVKESAPGMTREGYEKSAAGLGRSPSMCIHLTTGPRW